MLHTTVIISLKSRLIRMLLFYSVLLSVHTAVNGPCTVCAVRRNPLFIYVFITSKIFRPLYTGCSVSSTSHCYSYNTS